MYFGTRIVHVVCVMDERSTVLPQACFYGDMSPKWASHLLGVLSVFCSILAVDRLSILKFSCPSRWILGITLKPITTAKHIRLLQRSYWRFQSSGMLITLYHYTRRNIPQEPKSFDRDNPHPNPILLFITTLPLVVRCCIVRSVFCARPDRPWGPPSLLYNGYRVFPGGKAAEAWR
jgi:hypothetical protein